MIPKGGIGISYSMEISKPADVIIAQIEARLKERSRRILSTEGKRESSVLVPLVCRDDGLKVLMTLRSSHVSTHKGQISFPGGGREESDADSSETALRETWEETGVRPEQVVLLGQYDDYESITGHHVSVYIGYLKGDVRYTFNESEIADYTEPPVSIFAEKQYDRKEPREFKGRIYDLYWYYYDNMEIWGLTARIMTDFASEVLKD